MDSIAFPIAVVNILVVGVATAVASSFRKPRTPAPPQGHQPRPDERDDARREGGEAQRRPQVPLQAPREDGAQQPRRARRPPAPKIVLVREPEDDCSKMQPLKFALVERLPPGVRVMCIGPTLAPRSGGARTVFVGGLDALRAPAQRGAARVLLFPGTAAEAAALSSSSVRHVVLGVPGPEDPGAAAAVEAEAREALGM